MKNCLLYTILLALLPSVAFAHSGETHAPKTYKAMEREFGSYAPDMDADHKLTIGMSDMMRFDPDQLNFKVGDVVSIEVRNDGKIMHELVLGTEASLEAHAEMMRKHPNMAHDEPYMAHVKPGESIQILWRFDKPGAFAYGCLIPGHFEAGMKGYVNVQ